MDGPRLPRKSSNSHGNESKLSKQGPKNNSETKVGAVKLKGKPDLQNNVKQIIKSNSSTKSNSKVDGAAKPKTTLNKGAKQTENNVKPQVHRRFKKKPWQRYNPRTSTGQEVEESSSDSENENQGKYKKREIVDNSARFETPEHEEHALKNGTDEEEEEDSDKDFIELCEKMRSREKACDLEEPDALQHGSIPESVVLPKDFERELDQLLMLNVPQQELKTTSTAPESHDPESFTQWLEGC